MDISTSLAGAFFRSVKKNTPRCMSFHGQPAPRPPLLTETAARRVLPCSPKHLCFVSLWPAGYVPPSVLARRKEEAERKRRKEEEERRQKEELEAGKACKTGTNATAADTATKKQKKQKKKKAGADEKGATMGQDRKTTDDCAAHVFQLFFVLR